MNELLQLGEKYGWWLVLAVFVIWNAGKIVDRLTRIVGAFVPAVKAWGEARHEDRREKEKARVKRETDREEHTQEVEQVVIHHALELLDIQLQTGVKRDEASQSMLREVVEWQKEDNDRQFQELANIREQTRSLYVVTQRTNDLFLVLTAEVGALKSLILSVMDRMDIEGE